MSQDLHGDIANVLARTELSRRQMVVTSLAAGFAMAVQPVSAATITTSTEGLTAGEIKIPVGDATIPGYRAMPASGGPFPVVLVVQEIFGVHEHIKDVCRRFAKAGYMAIAPELFARLGDMSKVEGIPKVLEMVSMAPDDQIMADLDATVTWAKKTGMVDGARIGITGFCWGGRITWLYAARGPIKAGVAWYGRISHAVNANQTHTPLDIAGKLKGPVLGLYGGKDRGIPQAHLDLMKREIAASKGTS